MIYQIDMSSVAEAEADCSFLNLSQVTSTAQAKIWYDGLLLAI